MAHSRSGHADLDAANLGRISAVPSAVFGAILSGALILQLEISVSNLASLIMFFVIEGTLKALSKTNSECTVTNFANKARYIAGSSFAGVSLEFWELAGSDSRYS